MFRNGTDQGVVGATRLKQAGGIVPGVSLILDSCEFASDPRSRIIAKITVAAVV